MKTRILLLITLTLLSGLTYGQQIDNTYGKPLIVLTETDPWLMVIGSDVPSFALYEKGQIIYKSAENSRLKIYEITLTQEELQKVIQSFTISEAFYKLKDDIVASSWTDQPTNILTVNLKQTKTVYVYGRLSDKGEAREKTPKEFLSVYDNIKKFKINRAKEWLPKNIEVMFWDYNYALNKRPWIKGFPDLNSPTTIKFDNDTYSVFIDNDKFDEFKIYYSSMGEQEAVEINGRKMAISYRFPFPNL